MFFIMLYKHNLSEIIGNAKKYFIPLQNNMNSNRNEPDYAAPLSWAIGIFKCCISPLTALFKTGIDVYSRNICEDDLKDTIAKLNKSYTNKNGINKIVEEVHKNAYTSNSSKNLIKLFLENSMAVESAARNLGAAGAAVVANRATLDAIVAANKASLNRQAMLKFLNDPINKGTKLEQEICRATAAILHSPSEGYVCMLPLRFRRNSK